MFTRFFSLIVLISLFCGLAFFAGCEINKPEMPTFDTSVAIPLGIERIEIMDAIDDEDFLQIMDDGGLAFSIEGEPDTMDFDFDLSADIGTQSFSEGLGNFALSDLDPMSYQFELGSIWAPASGVTNTPAVVPAFPIDVSSTGQDIPDLESAILESGTATITVVNNLPVPVSANSGPDQIILVMENPSNGAAVATFTFPAIASGSSASQEADLSGVTLPDAIRVRMAGGSPGSSGGVVTVNGTDAISVDALFESMVVSSAMAVVGPQEFQSSFETELPADYEIASAVISEGSLLMTLTNDMSIPATAVISWAELQDHLGQPLVASFNLAAGQTLSQTIDFSDRVLFSDGDPISTLVGILDISTPGSGVTPVAMSAGDGLTADLGGGSLTFSSVTGIIPAYDVAIDPIVEEIDMPDELDGIELTSATMMLRITNNAGLPAEVSLDLRGTSANGTVRSMSINESILPAISRSATTTTITLNESNSTLVDFLNNLPESITMTGDLSVGGDGAQGTVSVGDYAIVDYEIISPLEVIITGSTISGDPENLDIDQDMRDMINDHALGARVETEILNHLPVAVQLRILASSDISTIETAPELVIGPLTVAAALVDATTHIVSEAVTSRPVINLTEEEARILGRANLHTMVEVILPAGDGNPVRMMATDFLEVRGIITMDILVNDQW